MSKCPNCGYESDSENKFCPKCMANKRKKINLKEVVE